MSVYYNEFDKKAAGALRSLIEDGFIAAGIVDERPIQEISPNDLKGFKQHHFFAGIGGWSIALRLAGWPDDRPVWTGSCPCQPFSTAGKRQGQKDERHLWPFWFRLIRESKPSIIFGEQVAAAIAHGWIDEVASDLEKEDYSIGQAVLPACAVGGFHKRDRLWFMGYSNSRWRRSSLATGNKFHREYSKWRKEDSLLGEADQIPLADSTSGRWRKRNEISGGVYQEQRKIQEWDGSSNDGQHSIMDNANSNEYRKEDRSCEIAQESIQGVDWKKNCSSGESFRTSSIFMGNTKCKRLQGYSGNEETIRRSSQDGSIATPDSLEWIECPDGKIRPVKPGICLLANGISQRIHLLRAAGNAIHPPTAAKFIQAAESIIYG